MNSKKHIVFVGPPLFGHMNQMIALAEELVHRRYPVTVASSETFGKRIREAGAQFVLWNPARESGGETAFARMEGLWDRVSREPSILRGEGMMLDVGAEMYLPMFESLKVIFQRVRPDLLVIDSTAVAAMDVARQLNFPYVILASFLGNHVKTNSKCPHFATGYSARMTFGQRCLNSCVPLMMLFHFLPGLIRVNRIRRQCSVRVSFKDLYEKQLMIVGSPFGLEIPRALPPHIKVVGPILAKTADPLGAALKEWLDDSGRGVVYVSLGTLATLEPWQAQTLAEGLCQNEYRILWALRQNQQSILPRLPEAFRVEPYVSQRAVLYHPAVRAFVSHCGRNSVNEALDAGKPILGLPFFSDQHFNAARVIDLGAGLRLDKNRFSREEVRSKIGALWNDPGYADAARRLSVALQKTGGLERAANIIEAFLDAGFSHSIPESW